jgi:threonine aldolase
VLADFAHENDMYLHIDGARIANAAVALNKSLKEITTDCGVDILSFGGTKNGLMFGEAIVVLNNKLSENIRYFRKQSTQLLSKMRFISCQFLAYLSDDLWKKNAKHANNMAQLLRNRIEETTDKAVFMYPTDANMLFVKLPSNITRYMLSKHFFYTNQDDITRLVTSWNTTEEDISLFIKDLYSACANI